MDDVAITVRRLTLYPKRKQPLVWVSRVAIFEHYNPINLIRNVPLHRGLNIVWGREQPDGDGDVAVDGHGVGKTTFCRLIRYCLGESHFARRGTRDQIRATFPGGYVGADIYVDGERWSVARPIGNSPLSYARKDSTIEDVLTTGRHLETYDGFRKHLEETVLRDLLIGATIGSNDPIKWDHLLAWCSRDQECRFQSLWDWRSPRSGSKTPEFKKPKVDATLMLRAALMLPRDDEVKAEERLFSLTQQLQDLEKSIAEREREPDFWRRHYRQRFVTVHGINDALSASAIEGEDMFNLPNSVRVKRSQLTELAEAKAEKLNEIGRDLAALTAQSGELEQLLDLDSATAGTKAASSEVQSGVSAETRQFLDELRRKAPFTFCRYGGVVLKDCSYVQDVLGRASDGSARPSATVLRTIAQNDQVAAAATERQNKWDQMVRAIKERQDALLAERRTVEEQKTALLGRVKDLDDSLRALQTWESYFTKSVPDPTLLKLHNDMAVAENEQTTLRAKLTQLLKSHSTQQDELTRIYNGAVQSILSAAYHGRVELGEEELLFCLAKATDIGGEALETLAILLADLTAMLLAIEGKCIHPGILIHDSPREADLGARIYASLLAFMRELHDKIGGDGAAPYQHIVTTTTEPPPLVQAGSIVLPLNAGEPNGTGLLFKRDLAATVVAKGNDANNLLPIAVP
jgi:hypothetical protein